MQKKKANPKGFAYKSTKAKLIIVMDLLNYHYLLH